MASIDCVIVDIDGTLADIDHRLHLLPVKQEDGSYGPAGPHWKDFYAGMPDDTPHPEIIALSNAMHASDYDIVLCTGRSDDTREVTETWLNQHGVRYHRLYMRRCGDHRPDDIIKEEMLDRLLANGFRPLFAVEDRARVVAMWRRRGLRCLQVCEGDF